MDMPVVDKETIWLTERYPRTVEIPGDGTAQFLLMTAAYAKEVHGFTTSLPPQDLLYLRDDIADPKVVNEWVRNINRGETITILARMGSAPLAGFASLHRTRSRWTRGVGELRVNVGVDYRSKGLGRMLTLEMIGIARYVGLRKLTAQMTAEQTTSRTIFHHLGFVEDATLPAWVEDRNGQAHDLVIMSHDLLE
jgi:L-amino acid N-acyltransferase YncA